MAIFEKLTVQMVTTLMSSSALTKMHEMHTSFISMTLRQESTMRTKCFLASTPEKKQEDHLTTITINPKDFSVVTLSCRCEGSRITSSTKKIMVKRLRRR